MVRLKEICRITTSFVCVISIPYGAIKRRVNISQTEKLSLFQFLMVRLKVLLLPCRLFTGIISIPYGAIKSPQKIK